MDPAPGSNNISKKQSREAAGRISWKFMRLRKRIEREIQRDRPIPAPFVSVHAEDKRESIYASLLLLFVIIQCICGFVFPICDALVLTNMWTRMAHQHKYFLEIFLLFQYIGGIIMLAYLQILISLYAKTYQRSEYEISSPTTTVMFQFSETESGSPQNTNSMCDQYNGKTSKFKRFFQKCFGIKCTGEEITYDKDGMNLYMRLGAVGFGLCKMIFVGFTISSMFDLAGPNCHSALWPPRYLLRLILILWQTYFVFKYHRVVINIHKPVVRFAYAHLAIVNMCNWFKVVITESALALKLSDEQSTAENLQHINGTLINESSTSYEQKIHISSANPNSILQSNCKGDLVQTFGPFLYPLIIEYSLIAGTLFFKMMQRINVDRISDNVMTKISRNTLMDAVNGSFTSRRSMTSLDCSNGVQTCTDHTKYRQLLGCTVYLPPATSFPVNDDPNSVPQRQQANEYTGNKLKSPEQYCHRSHSGLFLGLVVIAITTVGLFFFLSNRKTVLSTFSSNMYKYSMICLIAVGLLVSCLALYQTSSMKFRPTKRGQTFEYDLLGLGLVACLTYQMLLLVPALETIISYAFTPPAIKNATLVTDTFIDEKELFELVETAKIYFIKSTLDVLQCALQFFFIVEASRRGPCCPNQALIKPGRSAVLFLLLTNLALWIINSFEVRQVEQELSLYRHYYGNRMWSVFLYCFTPLIIFFRFHSTVCLAHIWSKMYEYS